MNKIPLSVSSTLSNVATANALMVTPYGNATGKTGTAAPVLIAVESDGTVGVEAFAAALPAKGGQGTAAQARLVVNALAELLSELVAEYGAITVNTPLGRIDTFVAGSLEYATDPVDPTVNVPFLGIVPGADVMKAFAQIETYVPTAACPASLKRIRDVATEDHAIHGTNPWYAQGYGMTTGGAGETVKLLNPLTRAEVCSVAVDPATKSEAQFKCTLPGVSAIPAGKYLLQIMTLAGGDTVLWPLELPVTLAEAVYPTPTVTKVATPGQDGIVKGTAFEIDGTNFAASATVKAKWTVGTTPAELSLTPTSVTPTKMSFAAVEAFAALPDNLPMTFEVKVYETTVTKATTLLPAALGPVLTSVHDARDDHEDGKIINGSGVVAEGQNLADATMKLAYTDTQGTPQEKALEASYTESKLIAPPTFWSEISVDESKGAKVIVTNTHGTAERTVTFREG